MFKNARFLNTSRRRTLARAGGLMTMTLLPVTYGYARVSQSDDAAGNLETQLRLLADHGIRADLIFSDIATGRTLRRAGWQELLSRLRPGDTLAVAFLDRLSRNFEDGVRIQADLTEQNIGIVALRENIDTSDGSAAAKFFRRSMLAQGAYQVDSTSERIKAGPGPGPGWREAAGTPARPDPGAGGAVSPDDGGGRGAAAHRPGDAVLAGHGEEGSGRRLTFMPYREVSCSSGLFAVTRFPDSVALGLSVGPRNALHDASHALVVGGVGVTSGLVEPDGGHGETAFLGQPGQVGGDEGRGCRHCQGAAGLGPGFEPAPGGVVHGPGVIGDAGVQGPAQPGQISTGETGCRRWERFAGVLGRWQERVLHGVVPSSSPRSAKWDCLQVAMLCSDGPSS